MQKRYPFKYLDAYTREDKDFYFGRDEEVKQLYEMTFQSDLLLVYGASGTGKTSLIQCGLANRFESHDWLALTVRRGSNINQSLERVLNEAIGKDTEYFDDEWETDSEAGNSPLARPIKTLRLKYFKPIYLIFDQFEELYILGNKDEQNQFYQTVKQLLALNQPVKIIITIREEYLGHLYYFEQVVSDILRKKLRVEPMTLDRVREVLLGINNPAKSLVTLQKGEEETLIQAIFDKLRENRISIDLPYLQVLLDKLYLSLTGNDEKHEKEAELTLNALEKMGSIGDILYGLLDGLVSQLKTGKNIAPETAWKTLSCFVTVEGTKEPLSASALQKQIPEIERDTLTEILQFFVSKRILRFDENEQTYEIAHDALAKQIHANRSIDEVAKLQIEKLIKDTVNKPENLREFFTVKQLKEIDLYLNRLELEPEEKDWIEQSRKKIRKEGRTKWMIIGFIFFVLTILLGITFWQWIETKKAKEKTQQAYAQAEKLVNAFYFYDGKFALAYGPRGFYFIDKEGNPVEKLGNWEKAEQFHKYTGFAKVIFSTTTCLLDTLGNLYKYGNNINELDTTIQALDLSRQGLSEIPIKLQDFKNLRYLDLGSNQLTSLPANIGKLSNLIYLDLRFNQFTSLPANIGKLSNLTSLDLSDNQLTSLPTEIGKLSNLTSLDLGFNQFTSLPANIGKLSNLTYLGLGSNQFTNLPDEISKLSNLTYLHLRSNKLTSLPVEIGKLSNLTYLRLGSNKLTSLPVEIGKLSNLTSLDLSNNQLTSLPAEISKLTNLEWLWWDGNPLDSISIQRVEKLIETNKRNKEQKMIK